VLLGLASRTMLGGAGTPVQRLHAVTTRLCGRKLGRVVISCNYNGWADAPEDEREALEVFEMNTRVACVALTLTRDAALLIRWRASRLPPPLKAA
jgi:hypothetical protein